jgi:hypothetical protein
MEPTNPQGGSMENEHEFEESRVEENELAIMVSSQPWASDPPVTESCGRRIVWPAPGRDERGWGGW